MMFRRRMDVPNPNLCFLYAIKTDLMQHDLMVATVQHAAGCLSLAQSQMYMSCQSKLSEVEGVSKLVPVRAQWHWHCSWQ
jgi:hypothetical protein